MRDLIAFVLCVLLIGGGIVKGCYNAQKVANVPNCRVLHLVQQSRLTGDKDHVRTEIRYLVATDRETFICESSIFNGKFNNSDVFYRLEEGKTYTFRVEGVGKGLFNDYRNILEATPTR